MQSGFRGKGQAMELHHVGKDDRRNGRGVERSQTRRSQLVVRPKLRVGAVNDPAEAEADRIASEVVRRLASGERGDAAAMAEPADVSRVRRAVGSMPAEGGGVDVETEQKIRRAVQSGSKLPSATSAEMGHGFGADFSGVRIHTDSNADTLNRSMGARAFTVDNDVFFASGEFQPSTSSGKHLLAHELAHTLQSRPAAVSRIVRRAPDDGAAGAAPEGAGPNGEEEKQGVVIAGTISKSELGEGEESSTAPPAGIEADGLAMGRTRRSSRRPSGSGRNGSGPMIPLNFRVGGMSVRSTMKRSDSMPSGDDDAAIAVNANTSGSISAGLATTPFGAASRVWNVGVNAYTVERKGVNALVTINASFDQPVQWGVNGGTHTDIASGSSPVVTADNYQEIVDDLTPLPNLGSWVPKRTKYWASALTERHEKFHANDTTTWGNTQGKAFVKKYIEDKQLSIGLWDLFWNPDTVKATVTAAVNDARTALSNANNVYMRGTGLQYYDYPTEVRAFGDGKQPYQDLADAVKVQGEKLAKEKADALAAAAAAAAPAATGTPATGATPPTGTPPPTGTGTPPAATTGTP